MTTSHNLFVETISENRTLIDQIHNMFQLLDEYEARGGAVFAATIPSGTFLSYGVTETQYNNLMGVITELETWFDARAGYFYEAAE